MRNIGVPSRQHGIALAIVVWFIAGMSILVAGIVAQARIDTRMAQMHVAKAKTAAAGDGAITLSMVDRLAAKRETLPANGWYSAAYRLGTLDIQVELIPVSQFIDVNEADARLLTLLFSEIAALDLTEAQRLADSVVQWRRPDRFQIRKMESPEDLMLAGVPRAVLDSVRDYIAAGAVVSENTRWDSMHPALQDLAKAYRPDQASGQPGDMRGGSSGYRADAIVRYGDTSWLRRRWISGSQGPFSTLPWSILRTETPRVVAR